MPTPISFPKGFKRLDSFALDDDSVFSSLASMQSYAAGGTSYAGQVIGLTQNGTTTIYRIEADKSLTAMATQGDAVAFAIALG